MRGLQAGVDPGDEDFRQHRVALRQRGAGEAQCQEKGGSQGRTVGGTSAAASALRSIDMPIAR